MLRRKNGYRSQRFTTQNHVALLVFLPLFMMLTGYLTSFLTTSTYYATATVMLIPKQDEQTAANYSSIIGSRELAKTCSAIARTDKVALNIQQQYNNLFTLKEIKDRVNVRLLPETALLQISASDSNRDTAAKLANTTANVIINEFKNVLSLSDARIVSQALPPPKPLPDRFIYTAVGGMIGLVLTFTIILILDYFERG
jgi:capsular polysaccharide biosynthesis protein